MKNIRYILISQLLFFIFFASIPFCKEEEYAVKFGKYKISMDRYNKLVNSLIKELNRQQSKDLIPQNDFSFKIQPEKIVLNQIIDIVIIEDVAEKQGIQVSQKDILDRIEKLKSNFQSSYEFHKSIAEQNMTIDDLKSDLRRQIIVEKIKEKLKSSIEVTNEDIEDFYNKNSQIFLQPEMIHIWRIVTPSKEVAEDALSRLFSGEKFEDVAREVSIDKETKDRGGDAGFIERVELEMSLREIAHILKPGYISPIIEGDDGYYIIKVDERIPEKRISLSQAAPSIKNFLLEERAEIAFQNLLEEKRSSKDLGINKKLEHLLK